MEAVICPSCSSPRVVTDELLTEHSYSGAWHCTTCQAEGVMQERTVCQHCDRKAYAPIPVL